jgi:acetyl esterase/lipase
VSIDDREVAVEMRGDARMSGWPGAGRSLRRCASMETYTYKRVGELAITADVFRDADRDDQPMVVFIHGGALINGHREWIPEWLVRAAGDDGYTLVALDYRLAPQTKLPEIVEDVIDAFRWLRDDGGRPFRADPKRVAVVGESAGGYLTLVTGFLVDPRPSALVSFWGYGDLIGDWYSRPSNHPCHHGTHLTRDEAYQQVAGPPIADERDRVGDGGAFYQFCRQQGTWPTAVSGWDPERDADAFRMFMPLANVSSDYPPTLLVHGDRDTDVPVEQSELMAAEFARYGVEHRLLSVAGGEHGLEDVAPSEVDAVEREAAAFLKDHLA